MECLSDVKKFFESFAQLFSNMKTEKQRSAQFRNFDTFIVPLSYKIGEKTEYDAQPTGTRRKIYRI